MEDQDIVCIVAPPKAARDRLARELFFTHYRQWLACQGLKNVAFLAGDGSLALSHELKAKAFLLVSDPFFISYELASLGRALSLHPQQIHLGFGLQKTPAGEQVEAYRFTGVVAAAAEHWERIHAFWQVSLQSQEQEEAFRQSLLAAAGTHAARPLAGWWWEKAAEKAPSPTEDFYRHLAEWQEKPARPCLFLDRDGVIIEDTGYPYRIADLHILPAVVPLVRWAKARDWHVVVVSNQAGIAKGIFSPADLEQATAYLQQQLAKAGAPVDAWYYCPYHPQAKVASYARDSLWRKPSPGMILEAMTQFKVERHDSFMIGDKASDAIKLPELRSLLLQGAYPLPGVASQVFSSHHDILAYLQQVTR